MRSKYFSRANAWRLLALLAFAIVALSTSPPSRAYNGYRPLSVTSSSATQVATTALLMRADQGIVFGGMVAPVATGTSPPAVTFTGTPDAATQSFEVDITGSGTRGVATATIKRNGAIVFLNAGFAPTEGPYNGVTVNFPLGTYTNDNVWTTVPAVTSWTSIDASHTVFSQATLASMPGWIAPGLSLPGFVASIGRQAGVRFFGAQQLTVTFPLAQPYTFAFVVSSSLATVQGWCASSGGPYMFVNSSSAMEFSEGANVFEMYASNSIDSPFAGGFIYNGAASQFVGAAGPTTSFNTVSLAGILYLGSLGGVDYLVGDMAEFWIDAEATPPLTWGQIRQGWVSRYGF